MLRAMRLAQLSALLFLIGLSVSRLGLLLHELAGHAGVARVLGCQIDGIRLFAFGGGYVESSCQPLPLAAALAIDVGGIGLELVVGTLLLIAARGRQGLLGLFLASTGLLFVLHAVFYSVTGVHYGVGDGRRLHLLLGERRTLPLWIGSVTLVVATGWCARLAARRLAAGVPGASRSRRVATLALAAIAAAALHGTLLLAEQRIAPDLVYAASFTPEPRTRSVPLPREPGASPPRAATSGPAPGALPSPDGVVTTAVAPFPLRAVLAAGMAIAALLGFASALRAAPPERDAPFETTALPRAGLVCALAVAAVLMVDRFW
jgi:hypothetical protein